MSEDKYEAEALQIVKDFVEVDMELRIQIAEMLSEADLSTVEHVLSMAVRGCATLKTENLYSHGPPSDMEQFINHHLSEGWYVAHLSTSDLRIAVVLTRSVPCWSKKS